MSKSNGHIHYNILSPSSVDTVKLSLAVDSRFRDLFDAYLRIRGVMLSMPRELDKDMLRWREMFIRHRKGDYRNTHSELRSLRTIAQWTVDVNRSIRNQKPMKVIWDLAGVA